MELWHVDFVEDGPKSRNLAKDRQKLDLSILVFILFHSRPLVRLCSIFPGTALVANGVPEKSERLGPF